MGAPVFFAQRRATQGGGLLEKLEQIFDAAGFSRLISDNDLVAAKVQVGERGNTTHLRPEVVKRIVKRIRAHHGRPFVTDCGSDGARSDAVGHTLLAAEHGFAIATLGAPFVVADGLAGEDAVTVPTPGRHLREAPFGAALCQADAVIVVSHFTAAPIFGYAGALHNLGYLGLARAHRHLVTHLRGLPVEAGAVSAAILDDDLPPQVAEEGLLLSCADAQERMVEACAGFARSKPGRCGYVTILLDVTPDPDSHPWSDAPVVPDIGVLASRDPVALDQACIDMVNSAEGIPGTRLEHAAARDKLAELHPEVDWSNGLTYAERLGLGTRDYELLII
ncbi:MAG: DUF362 domain-containing protein [Candidatus Sericytochromatia bacterium]|nr:DUF362 domain-containing protein [Candidatus Tanganyikabacteria bacterium]